MFLAPIRGDTGRRKEAELKNCVDGWTEFADVRPAPPPAQSAAPHPLRSRPTQPPSSRPCSVARLRLPLCPFLDLRPSTFALPHFSLSSLNCLIPPPATGGEGPLRRGFLLPLQALRGRASAVSPGGE